MTTSVIFTDGDGLVMDLGHALSECAFETGESGLAQLTATARLQARLALDLYRRLRSATVVVGDGLSDYYRGRVEDLTIDGDTLQITAFGLVRAYADLLTTALWSDSSTSEWQALTEDDNAAALPARWQQDNNNRLYAAPTQSEYFADGEAAFFWAYAIADGGSRDIARVTFSYTLTASSDWQLALYRMDSSWSEVGAAEWSLAGDGSTQTGSVTVDLSASSERIAFRYRYNASSTPTQYTGETADNLAKLTSVRVMTQASSAITADAVAEAIVNEVAAVNTVETSTVWIEASATDLDSLEFRDVRHIEALRALAAVVGADVHVWTDGMLRFGENVNARTYYADVATLTLQRSLDGIYSRVYAAFDGGNQRMAVARDALAEARSGVVRMQKVDATTTSSATAEAVRDAELAVVASELPKAQIVVDRLSDGAGALVDLAQVRAGDTIGVRNLDGFHPDLGELRKLKGTRFDVMRGLLTLIPQDLPDVEILAIS